jgi:hypothetical protein
VSDVGAWLAACPPAALPAIEALRSTIRAAGPDLVESIKWNAPSFAQEGEDRITLGLEQKGGVRAVLHRGAAAKADGFAFEDTAKLARWPSPDRGILKFRDAGEIEPRRPALADLFARWLEATR